MKIQNYYKKIDKLALIRTVFQGATFIVQVWILLHLLGV